MNSFLFPVAHRWLRVRKIPPDIQGDRRFEELYEACRNYTMTSPERMYALYSAVRYITSSGVPGAIVECGVWRGGSCMLCALTLMKEGELREIYLYDTFEGMTSPGPEDVRYDGMPASSGWLELGGRIDWCRVSIEEVQANLRRTGYPADRLHFVKGRVEDTLRCIAPDRIALLRLDTDWYESTFVELEVLFPRLSPFGILILDDYGHWRGSKQAVDEYFQRNQVRMLLHRIDYAARIGVKTPEAA
jgi:hypothetical protein